jgi:hypothetical protein
MMGNRSWLAVENLCHWTYVEENVKRPDQQMRVDCFQTRNYPEGLADLFFTDY